MRFVHILILLSVINLYAEEKSGELQLIDQKVVYLTGVNYKLSFSGLDSLDTGKMISIQNAEKCWFNSPIKNLLEQDNTLQLDVTFKTLSRSEIEQYWQSGECDDKAGAYAIQGIAAAFVTHLSGSYSGVMGLPLYETVELLYQAGISPNFLVLS